MYVQQIFRQTIKKPAGSRYETIKTNGASCEHFAFIYLYTHIYMCVCMYVYLIIHIPDWILEVKLISNKLRLITNNAITV